MSSQPATHPLVISSHPSSTPIPPALLPQVSNVDVFNHPELAGQAGVTTDKKRKQHHSRCVR